MSITFFPEDRENVSVQAVQQALRRLASNRAKISKERILEFIAQDQELSDIWSGIRTS